MNRPLLYSLLFPYLLFADIFPFQTIEKANEAYANGEFRKSARLFSSLDNKDTSIVYNKGNAYYKAGLYDLALSNYKKAKGMDEAIRAYNIGNVYFKKHDFSRAVEFYKASLALRQDKDTEYNLKLAEQKNRKKRLENKKSSEEKMDKKETYYQKTNNKNRLETSVSEKEKIRKRELSHLLKQISKKKMPTMLYQVTDSKREVSDENPW